jgi:hypothetical protein
VLLVLSIYQGAGTTRADDHTAGFSIYAIVLRDEHLWHEREKDQRLAVSDVGSDRNSQPWISWLMRWLTDRRLNQPVG